MRENFINLDAASRTALEGLRADDPVSRVQALGTAHVSCALAHPADFRLMFRPELAPPPALGNLETAPVIGVLVGVLREAGLNDAQSQITALAAWSFVHGSATLFVNGPL